MQKINFVIRGHVTERNAINLRVHLRRDYLATFRRRLHYFCVRPPGEDKIGGGREMVDDFAPSIVGQEPGLQAPQQMRENGSAALFWCEDRQAARMPSEIVRESVPPKDVHLSGLSFLGKGLDADESESVFRP